MPGRKRSSRAAHPALTRAVVYLRQSTYREESVSLEQQEAACREHCARHGYVVDAVISDPGLSGRKWSRRPGVQQAMTMLDEHRAEVLVLWKWSRISRRRLDFEIAMDRAEATGARIESATEPIDVTTASGKFARGMLAEVAAFESARIGEEWRSTHARRRSGGLTAQGGDRFGYRRLDANTYEVDPEQAAVLEWMYGQVIDGRGGSWIAQELNRRGIRNRVGLAWQQNRVFPLLDSGFAAGLLIHHRRDGENRKVGEAQHLPGGHPAIISEQVWQQYRAARRARTNRPSRVVEGRYPLTGLAVCGDCGAGMWHVRSKLRGAGSVLVCGRWQDFRDVRCVTVARHLAEAAVRDWLGHLAADVERAAGADQAARRVLKRAQQDRAAAAKRVKDVESQLADLALQLVRRTLPQAGYEAARDELLRDLDRAQDDVDAADQAAVARPLDVGATSAGLLERWDTLDPSDLRNVLSTLAARVVVDPPSRPHGRSSVAVVPTWSEPD